MTARLLRRGGYSGVVVRWCFLAKVMHPLLQWWICGDASLVRDFQVWLAFTRICWCVKNSRWCVRIWLVEEKMKLSCVCNGWRELVQVHGCGSCSCFRRLRGGVAGSLHEWSRCKHSGVAVAGDWRTGAVMVDDGSGGAADGEVREWWPAAAMVMVGEEEN